jgi:5-hydroxyisourate hydrolase-like protein (transthyretin family)
MKACIALLIVCASVCAQDSPQATPSVSAPVAPESRSAMDGQVLDAATGRPIPGAHLIVRRIDKVQNPSAPRKSTTDDDGRFSLSDLDPGAYRLWVNKDGYAPSGYGATAPFREGKTVEVPSTEPVRNLIVRLIPGAVLTGRIADRDGNLLGGFQVRALRQYYGRGFRELVPGGETTTGSNGEYRLTGLASGEYYVYARPARRPGNHERADHRRLEFPGAFYPGTADITAAATIRAAPGAELRDINFAVEKTRTSSIRGHVLNPLSEPTDRMLMVSLQRENSVFPPEIAYPDGKSGAFGFTGILPGSYTLAAEWFEGDDRYTARQSVTVGDSDVEGVKLVVEKGAQITGTVRTDGVQTFGCTDFGLQLESKELIRGMSMRTQVKDGKFAFTELPSDVYIISVPGMPASCYVKSIRLGTQELTHLSELDFPGVQTSMEITAVASAGQITAAVSDLNGQPAAGMLVVAVPEADRRGESLYYRIATTQQNGEADLTSLTPGDYKLFAWREIEPGAYYDPEFMRLVEANGASLRVTENSRKRVPLVLSSPYPE